MRHRSVGPLVVSRSLINDRLRDGAVVDRGGFTVCRLDLDPMGPRLVVDHAVEGIDSVQALHSYLIDTDSLLHLWIELRDKYWVELADLAVTWVGIQWIHTWSGPEVLLTPLVAALERVRVTSRSYRIMSDRGLRGRAVRSLTREEYNGLVVQTLAPYERYGLGLAARPGEDWKLESFTVRERILYAAFCRRLKAIFEPPRPGGWS